MSHNCRRSLHREDYRLVSASPRARCCADCALVPAMCLTTLWVSGLPLSVDFANNLEPGANARNGGSDCIVSQVTSRGVGIFVEGVTAASANARSNCNWD